jgi:hypothetical protein
LLKACPTGFFHEKTASPSVGLEEFSTPGTSADVQRLRCKFIPIYYTRYANMYKMKGLLSLCNVKVLKKLSYLYLNCKMFCNYILRLYYFRLVISVIM